MSEKRMPAFRLKYRSADKQNYDVGVCWPGKFDGSWDVKPETQTVGGQYPKMALSEALQRVANRDGWLSLVAVGPKRDAKAAQSFDSGGGGGDFDDVPFAAWVEL